ncbi:hypothetical protein BGZ76_008326 [Entomortierella beljakovae]|nr:hypothetical protein BGZ76_008326 [Entomortierella beljakovae]
MRYASEQGILLAQKSRTSLNKLLDSVMDNAAALAESKHQPQLNSISTTTAATITRNCSSAKFYIDDDDSSEEEEEESEEGDEQSFLSTPGSIKAHQKDYYRERSEQDIFHEKDQFIKASSPGGLNTSAPHPIQSSGYLELGRRQSLLSNMLIAEKHLAAQRASSSKHLNSSAIGKPRQSSFPSISYPCHNSNLQGGDSIGFTVNSQLEAQSSLKISIGGARPHEEIIVPNQINNFEKIPISPPLRRTKTSLFKNLDGLISNPSNENRQEVSSRQSQGQQPTVVSKIAPIMATASEPNDCKTVHVILDKPNTHSQIISHRKKYTPHSTLPAPTKTCRCSPATATTKTAFATVSATSKCTATTTSSAASIAAAIAATACIGEDNTLGWAQMNHIQTQIQSVYGHITSSIQKAISTASSSLQM